MSMIIAGGLFLILMFVISWFGYRRYVQPVRLFDELRRGQLGQTGYRSEVIASAHAPREKPAVRLVRQIGAMLPVAPGDAKAARRELIQAGYRGENAAQIYYGLRVF